MNKKYKNIFFMIETYNGSSFRFLNLKMCKNEGKFTKLIFRKDQFSGYYVKTQNCLSIKTFALAFDNCFYSVQILFYKD